MICRSCHQEKTPGDFYPGVNSRCKECHKKVMRKYSLVPRKLRPKRGGLSISYRLENTSMPVTESGCWLWLGQLDAGGYGCIRIGRKMIKAHRASFMVYRDMIPKGIKVLHHCDIPSCINPDHLFLGTQADNVRDMITKGRHRPSRGQNNGRAKLNERQAAVIRESKETLRVLSERYGVSPTIISYVKRGISWK